MNLPLNLSLSIIFLLGSSLTGTGQNLVSNGSFENMVNCPTGPGQVYFAQGWDTSRESPDYDNSCASLSAPYFGVPSNGLGHQHAATGNAYVGIICYNSSVFSREIIAGSLTTPLSIGQQYYLTFKANRADDTIAVGYSTNNLGANLSTVMQTNASIDNAPLFHTDNVVSDTLNWTTISGSFIADSAYQYLMIGNFFDDANTAAEYNGGSGVYAYYYIDDVCLSTDSLLCANFPTAVEENSIQNQFSFYPNPATDFLTIQNRSNAPFDVEIYNTVGQLLHTEQNVTSGDLQLDISPYSEGLLFIKTISLNNQLIHKLVKQ
jgi:hypothetical protein